MGRRRKQRPPEAADYAEVLDAWEAMQRRREYRVAAWRALVEADSAETGAEADDELTSRP